MRSMNEILQLAALLAASVFAQKMAFGLCLRDSGSCAIPTRVGHVGLECSLLGTASRRDLSPRTPEHREVHSFHFLKRLARQPTRPRGRTPVFGHLP